VTPDVEERLRQAAIQFASELAGILRDWQPAADAPDRLLDVDEAAALLGIGRTFAYRQIAAGRLASLKVGRRRLVPAGAVRDYIDQASRR
jgi:excisionase family DNA binding protein